MLTGEQITPSDLPLALHTIGFCMCKALSRAGAMTPPLELRFMSCGLYSMIKFPGERR